MATTPNPAVTPPVAPPATKPAEGATPPVEKGREGGSPPSPQEENLRQLREGYEQRGKDLEAYSKLGKTEELAQAASFRKSIIDEVNQLGSQLGYPTDEIKEAIEANALNTLLLLRQEFEEAKGGKGEIDVEKLLDDRLSKRLGPLEQELNVRRTDEANTRFDSEFDRLFAEAFKNEQLENDEKESLYNLTADLFKYDDEGMARLKDEGKVSDVAKYFQEAKTSLDKYYVARSQRESKRGGGGRSPVTGGEPSKKHSLDDLINDPSLINQRYVES